MKKCVCPSCGANLEVKDENREFLFCEYCGAKVSLVDSREDTHYYDEAKIKEVELEKERLRYEEARKNRNRIFIWVGIAIGCVLLTAIIALFITDNYVAGMMLLLVLFFAGWFALMFYESKKKKDQETEIRKKEAEEENYARQHHYIRMPDIVEEDVITAREQMLEAGFTHVDCVCLYDLSFRKADEKGHVEEVKNNDGRMLEGKYYSPDSHVIITFHGMRK